MRTQCLNCRNDVPSHYRWCVVCGADAGAPNVRAAEAPDEIAALDQRYSAAKATAEAHGYKDILERFESAVSGSCAVMNRGYSRLQTLVQSESAVFRSFYVEVESGVRLPEDNGWDLKRTQAEDKTFPFYKQHILFACLSLDGNGVSGYGPCSIVLKDVAVADRASVMEKNNVLMVAEMNLGIDDSLPPGYRASWIRRKCLAIAKLAGKLDGSSKDSDFPTFLIDSPSPSGDFIEVHIYGPIHQRAINLVRLPQEPSQKADKALYRSLKRELRAANIQIEGPQ